MLYNYVTVTDQICEKHAFKISTVKNCNSVNISIKAVPIQIRYQYQNRYLQYLQYRYRFVHCSVTPI